MNQWFRQGPDYVIYPDDNWVVVSYIFYFQPYLGKWSNLTNIFQMGWFNHQLDKVSNLSGFFRIPPKPMDILGGKSGPLGIGWLRSLGSFYRKRALASASKTGQKLENLIPLRIHGTNGIFTYIFSLISMVNGIFTYIFSLISMVNVEKYTIHGWYGNGGHEFPGGGNSNIFYFLPRKLGKITILTNIFQRGWFNHHRTTT